MTNPTRIMESPGRAWRGVQSSRFKVQWWNSVTGYLCFRCSGTEAWRRWLLVAQAQKPARVAAVYFCQIRLAQTRLLDHPNGVFSVLLSLLSESERIISAKYDL